MIRTRLLAAAFSLAAILLSANPSRGQENPNRPPWAQPVHKKSSPSPASTDAPVPIDPQPPSPAQDRSRPQSGSKTGTISVRVSLVNVLVSVVDDHNRPAPDLPREAFEIYEEGVRQKVEIFEPETQQPLDLALMIDSSLSAHKEIVFEREAAAHFIRQILRPSDRLAIYSFDENVKRIANFSGDVAALQEALKKIADGAGTSIYDALVASSRDLEERQEDRRRVVIMVTDGGETTSRADFDAARVAALRAGILLYTIVIRPVKNENGRNTAGEHALETITDSTGGGMFFPDEPQELDKIFDRIDKELRTQYRLAYYPTPHGPANSYRTLEVKVLKPGFQTRHRKKYLTGAE
ncbi:MAG TPA: VWA domain-containing protein [Candidatus Eremiobacteraceae bacterium]|nr:VWA domain-containing protein [Candidatus Eremiobacteraceae bacterium]